jgi:endoglucanase
MKHFANDDGLNLFRLREYYNFHRVRLILKCSTSAVSWQFLIANNETAGGILDPTNFAEYDQLVQACLATGAHCIIDIHNYARFNNVIIGQGGPTNEVFASLWSNIASKVLSSPNI